MSSKPLDTQVGGHPGVMSDASGSLIMKETLPREIAFYQFFETVIAPTVLDGKGNEARTDTAAALYAFKRVLPKYYGTMAVPAQAEEGAGKAAEGGKADKPEKASVESIVLENVSYPFTRPSILDVKLGTILHDIDATPEKKARMEAQAAKYTAKEMGMRLTGFRTWHPRRGEFVVTDKAYGREIKKEQLPEGIAKFFPDPNATEEEYGNGVEPFDTEAHTDTLVRVLAALYRTLAHLHSVMSAMPVHFVGASFLIVYESDPAALARAWQAVDEDEAQGDGLARRKSGENEDEEWFGFGGKGEARGVTQPRVLRSGRDTPRGQNEDGGVEDEDKASRPAPPWSIRMIDFAHTRFVDEEEGPMPGVLLGIRNLGDLVKGRIDELTTKGLSRSTSEATIEQQEQEESNGDAVDQEGGQERAPLEHAQHEEPHHDIEL